MPTSRAATYRRQYDSLCYHIFARNVLRTARGTSTPHEATRGRAAVGLGGSRLYGWPQKLAQVKARMMRISYPRPWMMILCLREPTARSPGPLSTTAYGTR